MNSSIGIRNVSNSPVSENRRQATCKSEKNSINRLCTNINSESWQCQLNILSEDILNNMSTEETTVSAADNPTHTTDNMAEDKITTGREIENSENPEASVVVFSTFCTDI